MSAEASPTFEKLGLLVVKPDGVVQGVTDRLLHWLAERHLRPLALREVTMTPSRRAQLYATTSTAGRLEWDLNAVLYTLGPVHGLLVRGDVPPGHADVSDYVSRTLKGHFVPSRTRAGTIRGDLGALNPIFNLVHATDGTVDLAREVYAVFDLAPADLIPPTAAALSPSFGAARPFPLWSTVADCLSTVSGCPAVRRGTWPDDRLAACAEGVLLARDSWGRLLSEATDPAQVDWLAGVVTGTTSWPAFRAATATGDWAAYLTYTTIRHLDLCLENLDAR